MCACCRVPEIEASAASLGTGTKPSKEQDAIIRGKNLPQAKWSSAIKEKDFAKRSVLYYKFSKWRDLQFREPYGLNKFLLNNKIVCTGLLLGH